MKHSSTFSSSSTIAALLIGVLAGLVIAACGGSQPRKTEQEVPGGGRVHDELRALDARINADLATLGLTAPTDAELTEMMVAHAVPEFPEDAAAAACDPPPVGDGCNDVCVVGDAICRNAREICDLAAELDGDAWAAQRCASGKASCERARERCCAC